MSTTKNIVRDLDHVEELDKDSLLKLVYALARERNRSRVRLKQSETKLRRLKKKYKQSEEEGHTDFLTGLSNRRGFDRYLNGLERHHSEETVGLVMLDVDGFKKINDTRGHDLGDIALKTVARILLSRIRPNDMLCRFGGDEFVFIVRESGIVGSATKEEAHAFAMHARRLTERMREGVASHDWDALCLPKITLSVGIDFKKVKVLAKEKYPCKKADEALYLAKRGGRNRVVDSAELKKGLIGEH